MRRRVEENIQEGTANINGYLRACMKLLYIPNTVITKIYTYIKTIRRKSLNNGLDRDPSELFASPNEASNVENRLAIIKCQVVGQRGPTENSTIIKAISKVFGSSP